MIQHPDPRKRRCCGAHPNEHNGQYDCLPIQLSLQATSLGRRPRVVEHDLGILASIHHDPYRPGGVLELTATEHDVGGSERDTLAIDLQVGLEAVDVPVGPLAMQDAADAAVAGEFELRLLPGVPGLEVGLPVEVDGLDVRDAGGVAGG